jgi:adenine-specific DNA glycosylase
VQHNAPNSIKAWLKSRAVDRLPELPKRPQVTLVTNVAASIVRNGKLLVGQLPTDAPRWPSMWQLPNVNLEPEEAETQGLTRVMQAWCGGPGQVGERQHSLTHSVTRYRITVNLFEVRFSGGPKSKYCQTLTWVDRSELDALAMPSAHRKLALRVLGD